MTPDELLAEMEQDIAWRQAEVNNLLAMLSPGQTPSENSLRRSVVPLIQAHAEGFIRFALQAYLRFINMQSVRGVDASYVHTSMFLSKKFQTVREMKVDDDYDRLNLPEDNRYIKRHYVEAKFIEALELYLSDVIVLDDSQLERFDQNIDKPYLMGLLFQCGLDPLPHEHYAHKLNGLVRRRNEIAHGESSGASIAEIRNWDQCLSDLFRSVRDAVFEAAKDKAYLKV
jgi:hypothetical protein